MSASVTCNEPAVRAAESDYSRSFAKDHRTFMTGRKCHHLRSITKSLRLTGLSSVRDPPHPGTGNGVTTTALCAISISISVILCLFFPSFSTSRPISVPDYSISISSITHAINDHEMRGNSRLYIITCPRRKYRYKDSRRLLHGGPTIPTSLSLLKSNIR